MSLEILRESRELLEQLAPGFDAALHDISFLHRESAAGGVVALFKHAGPVALLIPKAAGGCGASMLDAVHIQFALGSRSPSLAVATTMHQFSIASLLAMQQNGGGAEILLLTAIAANRLLISSGFAEGVPGQGILESNMTATETDEGVYLTGIKKPCSLARSMDLLTASYLRSTACGEEVMVALIPAQTAGITRKPYWSNEALAGAESDAVELHEVFVAKKMVFSVGLKNLLEPVQLIGFYWFELLISAAYLGVCAGLVEQVIEKQRWSAADRVDLVIGLQLALSSLRGAAHEYATSPLPLEQKLARLLLVRYGIERSIASISDQAMRMAGGSSFASSAETSRWLTSCRGLAFHPPANFSMRNHLDRFITNADFTMT